MHLFSSACMHCDPNINNHIHLEGACDEFSIKVGQLRAYYQLFHQKGHVKISNCVFTQIENVYITESAQNNHYEVLPACYKCFR